ncbi:GroES-like protein [Clavulina sp. PMI_390]|nr:GroES-like protein [Clavulina sp. PMI_390]
MHLALVQEAVSQPLAQTQVPTISPQPNKIQVRISAVGLNPGDQKQWTGNFMGQMPLFFGHDGSGSVTEVGQEVTGFSVGGMSFLQPRISASATFQEIAILDTTAVIKIPSRVTFTQAATIPVPYYTAYSGLFHSKAMNLPPPAVTLADRSQPILVWGAGSAVGRAALQILTRVGYTNVLATAGRHRFEELKSFGAQVFDYNENNVTEQIKGALNGQELKDVFDAISMPESISEIAKVISPGAAVCSSPRRFCCLEAHLTLNNSSSSFPLVVQLVQISFLWANRPRLAFDAL